MFITEMADDLAYGLAVRRAQAERRRMEGESDLATDAVALFSLGEAERRSREGAVFKLLPLDGVAATSRMVRTGEFPISRSLNLVTKGFPDGVKLAFMQLALSSQIIDLVRDYDFVPYLD